MSFTQTSLSFVGAILFLMGLICGVEVLTFTIAIEKSPRHLAASAVAFVNFILMASNALMQYTIGFVLDYFWDGAIINGAPIYSASAYRAAISIIPVLSAIITLIFIYEMVDVKRRKKKMVVV